MPTFRPNDAAPDPRLERALRRIVLAGAMLVLALPIARGHSLWFGALPLWLLAMPLASWWALHHFRLPRLPQSVIPVMRLRRRRMAQARRRPGPRVRGRFAHAA